MPGENMGPLIFVVNLVIWVCTVQCCHGNSLPYKHPSPENREISLDKIVILDDNEIKDKKMDENMEKNIDENMAMEKNIDEANANILQLVNILQAEMTSLKISQEQDRRKIIELETTIKQSHDQMTVSGAEVIQLRQLVFENYDKTARLEEFTQDNRIAIERLQLFQKEIQREMRQMKEYRENTAKHFHHLENQETELEQSVENHTLMLNEFTQGLQTFNNDLSMLRNLTEYIQLDVTKLNLVDAHINRTMRNLTTCFISAIQSTLYSPTNPNSGNEINKKREYSVTNRMSDDKIPYNEIEIMEFGSGNDKDKSFSWLEEVSNQVKQVQLNTPQFELGSGETIYEGTGEDTNGEKDFPHIEKFEQYVHKSIFESEIEKTASKFAALMKYYENLTMHVSQIETRLTSIQLGNFMQSLQESFINFTKNVITIDQYQMSSNQIVNSTIVNQDQIIKLTNIVLDNKDKLDDLRWQVSNGNLLRDQQFNIFRMYLIRLNNSVEDIKEHMKLYEKRLPLFDPSSYQSSFYDHNDGQQTTGNENQYRGNTEQMENVISRIENLGLQIVFNQNRLANLEVTMLNESLYTCRKYNTDVYQETQLANHEAIIRSNTNSIIVTRELVKELDDRVKSLYLEVIANTRRIRQVGANVTTFKAAIPIMVGLKREVTNFLFQLPTDCSEYYERGQTRSGIYVIHPITSHGSNLVTCHMTKDGGWTVIQQRFDGSVNFNRNWTDYRNGFGEIDSEYWLGNHLIHLLTTNKNYSLQIEMVDVDNIYWVAQYNTFKVANSKNKYTLSVSGYSGNITDCLIFASGMSFSTQDNDNDGSSTDCAYFHQAGWWYKHCQLCNLNGRFDIGFTWFNQDTYNWIRLKSSVMLIQPR